jgi:hypothetical protein
MTACECTEHAETFWTLVTDLAHWELELFIMLVFDVIIGMIAWPFVRKHWVHHLAHDKAHPETTPTPGIGKYDPKFGARTTSSPQVARFQEDGHENETVLDFINRGGIGRSGPVRRT